MQDLGMGDARKDGGQGFVAQKTSTIQGQGGPLTGDSKLDQQLKSTDSILKAKPENFHESASMKGGDVVSPGNSNDLGVLNRSLGQQVQHGSQMQSDFSRLGGLQAQEGQRNATLGKQVEGLGQLKTAFGAKEKAHQGKEQAFKGAGDALNNASPRSGHGCADREYGGTDHPRGSSSRRTHSFRRTSAVGRFDQDSESDRGGR